MYDLVINAPNIRSGGGYILLKSVVLSFKDTQFKCLLIVNETLKHFGRIDSLINNASNFYASPIGKITEKSWDDLIGCNLKAPLFLSQAAAPHLKKQHGCIINIIDIHSEWPLKKYTVYSSAKGGLATLTKSLALELAPESE